MLPDDKLGTAGFHDVIIENLSATPTWRSSHVPQADMTSLCRRWPKAVFNTLRRRASDKEPGTSGPPHRYADGGNGPLASVHGPIAITLE